MAEEPESFDRERYQEEVREKMADLSREAQVAIAARAAWRMVPLMFPVLPSMDELAEWWQHNGHYLVANLIVAASYEQHRGELSYEAVEVARSSLRISESSQFSTLYPEGRWAVDHVVRALLRQSDVEATSNVVAAFGHILRATRDYALVRGRDTSLYVIGVTSAIDGDISQAREGGVTTLPLWSESTRAGWLHHWFERAQETMPGIPIAQMLNSWLVQWARGHPPLDAMRVWFNDWWLNHPENKDRSPAYSDMPAPVAKFSTLPLFPQNGDLLFVSSKPPEGDLTVPTTTRKRGEEKSKPALPETQSAPSSPPPTPEPPEQVNIRRHLESTVALASDREAKQLTPTAEKCKEALARFLASKETQAPLTVSVEAPWGAGKTSFMHHLRKRLEAEKIPTVWFNPWKHEAGKTMWAAFALEYERQMARQLWWLRCVCCRVLLNFRRMGWPGFTLLLLRLGLWTGVGGLLWLVAPQVKAALDSVLKQAGEDSAFRDWLIKWLPLVGPAWIILKDLIKITGIPLKRESMQGLNRDPHAEGVDDLHRFHEDFARLMCAYHPANGWWARLFQPKRLRRVVVFIDDLDRCEAPKAADVLQSLHLMLNVTESAGKRMPEMICVLGMDRKKVAAAVAAKHEKLLPMLVAEDDKGTVPPARALAFGNQFLEKFIQLTLHLPGMMGADRVHYLREITGLRDEKKVESKKYFGNIADHETGPKTEASLGADVSLFGMRKVGTIDGPSFPLFPEQSVSEQAAEQVAAQVRVRDVDEHLHDGQTAFDCASYVADALENNPRRLKQFVNLLRLRLLLAAALDLLDADTLSAEVTMVKEGKLSAHHLAKLVALDLMCPQSMAVMRDNPGTALEGLAVEIVKEHGARKGVFSKLMAHGTTGENVIHDDPFNLAHAPLYAYFQQLASVAPVPVAVTK